MGSPFFLLKREISFLTEIFNGDFGPDCFDDLGDGHSIEHCLAFVHLGLLCPPSVLRGIAGLGLEVHLGTVAS